MTNKLFKIFLARYYIILNWIVTNKCLYCYKALNEVEQDFHTTCAKKMFGTKQAPIIDFNLKELEDLAKQIVIKSVAVTGVQPKLSLEIEKHKNELDLISYTNENLYFKNSLLLEKVKEFSLSSTSTNIKIDINYDDKIKQSWEFKKWKNLIHY